MHAGCALGASSYLAHLVLIFPFRSMHRVNCSLGTDGLNLKHRRKRMVQQCCVPGMCSSAVFLACVNSSGNDPCLWHVQSFTPSGAMHSVADAIDMADTIVAGMVR